MASEESSTKRLVYPPYSVRNKKVIVAFKFIAIACKLRRIEENLPSTKKYLHIERSINYINAEENLEFSTSAQLFPQSNY